MKAAALIKKENGVETKICRWCLSKCAALKPLANDESGQYKLQQLFDCTGFQANVLPGVPVFLCTKCESRLDKMYTFRWRCNKNIALVDAFIAEHNTAKNEADISKGHLGHSAEQTVGTELLIKTEVTTPDAAHDLPLIQRSCTAHQVNGTHECYGNQADDLFEAEENPIAFKLENSDVDEQDNSPTKRIDLICQVRDDPSATTNACVNDAASKSIQNGIAAIDAGKRLKVGRKRKNDQEKTLHRLRSYNLRSRQQVDSGRNRNTLRKNPCSKQKHPCPHCSATYILPSQLKIHIRTHTGEKPYVCNICSKAFKSGSNLSQHMKIHNKDEYKQCPYCPSKIAQSAKLKEHIRIHTGEKPFVCKICKKAFHSSSALSYHSKLHNKDEYKQCPYCPSKIAQSAKLKEHIRIHTGEKPFVCKICKKAFHSSSALSYHSKLHNKDEYKQCPHCPSKFAQSSSLKDHIRIHTGEKPFGCKMCDQTFRFSSSLAHHSKIHKKNR